MYKVDRERGEKNQDSSNNKQLRIIEGVMTMENKKIEMKLM